MEQCLTSNYEFITIHLRLISHGHPFSKNGTNVCDRAVPLSLRYTVTNTNYFSVGRKHIILPEEITTVTTFMWHLKN